MALNKLQAASTCDEEQPGKAAGHGAARAQQQQHEEQGCSAAGAPAAGQFWGSAWLESSARRYDTLPEETSAVGHSPYSRCGSRSGSGSDAGPPPSPSTTSTTLTRGGRRHSTWFNLVQGIRRSLDVHLKSYYKIDNAFSQCLKHGPAHEKLVALAKALVGTGLVDFCGICLINPLRNTFGTVALCGPGSEHFPALLSLPSKAAAQQPAGKASASGQPQPSSTGRSLTVFNRSVFDVEDSNWAVEDVAGSRSPWFYDCSAGNTAFGLPQEAAWLKGAGMRSVLALPCMYGNDVHGVVTVASRHKTVDHLLLRKLEDLCFKATPLVVDAGAELARVLANRDMASRFESVSDFAHALLGEMLNLDRAVSTSIQMQQLVAAQEAQDAVVKQQVEHAARLQALLQQAAGGDPASRKAAVAAALAAVAAASQSAKAAAAMLPVNPGAWVSTAAPMAQLPAAVPRPAAHSCVPAAAASPSACLYSALDCGASSRAAPTSAALLPSIWAADILPRPSSTPRIAAGRATQPQAAATSGCSAQPPAQVRSTIAAISAALTQEEEDPLLPAQQSSSASIQAAPQAATRSTSLRLAGTGCNTATTTTTLPSLCYGSDLAVVRGHLAASETPTPAASPRVAEAGSGLGLGPAAHGASAPCSAAAASQQQPQQQRQQPPAASASGMAASPYLCGPVAAAATERRRSVTAPPLAASRLRPATSLDEHPHSGVSTRAAAAVGQDFMLGSAHTASSMDGMLLAEDDEAGGEHFMVSGGGNRPVSADAATTVYSADAGYVLSRGLPLEPSVGSYLSPPRQLLCSQHLAGASSGAGGGLPAVLEAAAAYASSAAGGAATTTATCSAYGAAGNGSSLYTSRDSNLFCSGEVAGPTVATPAAFSGRWSHDSAAAAAAMWGTDAARAVAAAVQFTGSKHAWRAHPQAIAEESGADSGFAQRSSSSSADGSLRMLAGSASVSLQQKAAAGLGGPCSPYVGVRSGAGNRLLQRQASSTLDVA